MSKTILSKSLGPVGKARYRYTNQHGPDEEYQEMKRACEAAGFKLIYDDTRWLVHEFMFEVRKIEDDAIFVLTWADVIDFAEYEHGLIHNFPADWLTKLMYYTRRFAERNIGMTIIVMIGIAMIPIIMAAVFDSKAWYIVTSWIMMLYSGFAVLGQYDDWRIKRHERKFNVI
jgi:hypothetical protein